MRFRYIDRTKGLAILLVVVGHLIAREPPPGDVEWYEHLKHIIYTFHMPLFMAVSGLVYGLTWKPAPTLGGDMTDARRRVLRLLPSYLLFGIVVFLGKLTFQTLGQGVDNPLNGAGDLVRLLVRPSASFASFLWYIYALSVLYIVFPLAFRAARGYLLPLLVVSGAFWLLPNGTWFAWDKLRLFTVFYVMGVIAGRHHEVALRWLGTLWIPALVAFVALLPFAEHNDWAGWATAWVSLLALPGLLRATESWPLGLLDTIGRYTLIIYLTNTIFIGLLKVAAVHVGVWEGRFFPLIAVVMTVVAIGGAILLKRTVLPLYRPLDRITS